MLTGVKGQAKRVKFLTDPDIFRTKPIMRKKFPKTGLKLAKRVDFIYFFLRNTY